VKFPTVGTTNIRRIVTQPLIAKPNGILVENEVDPDRKVNIEKYEEINLITPTSKPSISSASVCQYII
jgi:hypothetical protein